MDKDVFAIGTRANEGDTVAQLYWMALARLTCQPAYSDRTPEDVHNEITALAADVYRPEVASKYGEQATNGL